MKENPTARAAPIERMQERIPDSDYQQLHHFISKSTARAAPLGCFWGNANGSQPNSAEPE